MMLRLSAVFVLSTLLVAPALAGPKPPASHCPPGLAKKGCVPPGQAKKRYTVGQPLPGDVAYAPAPSRVVIVAGQPGPGERWVEVDNDLLLIEEATRQVIRAIDAVERAAKGF